ncbi:MAG: DNA primase [Candidatus Staskawiczbacteria bacterium RIFCSPLOWO2_01_FULL_33_9]|uniref:DNA primase n=1 Tax=Candidatus Staskawiczbacteria bacterium RIFCSPLOWO2_01_FULL_33_9 TaxID=1802211 RepID=A0A1G2I662_9BACT|nr:MAG: DNA primase [Candidatus Staskawiczbacteria bacterium RIFCSPLOWO2_01_FULL_33_9]
MLDSQLEEIKNKLNVVDVVGGYIKLTKTGANYRGVCPFHSEKKPSFFVSPARQIWKCFGCGKGGDIFGFIKDVEGVEFGDALRILAEKAGVTLKRENKELRTQRQRLYEICELACCFFEKQLEASIIGKKAKEYLLNRGITEESIKKWRLGYSPDTWQGLSDFLVSKGYIRDEIIKAGLAVEKEGNRTDSYDRFRGRIIFPVFDLNSQPVGFGARVFEKPDDVAGAKSETAKYLNTPQTLLYDKSNILYGLNNAKLSIRKKNQCVITEGYTDVILCHQAGFENTVAASGTALTSQHLNILKRYSGNLLLAFDMDIAGDSATKRGVNLAQDRGFNIRIIEMYSKDADPADIILKNPADWEKLVNESRSIMDYYFDSAFSSFSKETAEGKKEIGKIVLPAIKRLLNKIEQSHWIQKLSQKLNVSESAILEELSKVKFDVVFLEEKDANFKTDLSQNKNLSSEGRKKLIEEKIISLVLKDPENLNLIEDNQYLLFSEKTKIFLEGLKKFIIEQKVENDFKVIFSEIMSDNNLLEEAGFKLDLKNFLLAFSLRAEIEYEEEGQDEIKLCILQLKNINIKEKLNKVAENIKEAEKEQNHQKVNNLIEEFNKLTKEL